MKASPYTNSTYKKENIQAFRLVKYSISVQFYKLRLHRIELIYTSIEFFWSTIQAGRAIPKLVARKGNKKQFNKMANNADKLYSNLDVTGKVTSHNYVH